ncbi:MAG: GIY-YIG nuclease family protein [Candidatus Taylorbacteria bacterium]
MLSQHRRIHLPDKPGIYIFRDQRGRPLYIGRATSLRDRVKSYFSNDLIETRGPRIVDMVTRAAKLTHEETDSVLEAIILESNLIKRYQPKYNVDERDDKSDLYIVITKESWPRVFTVRVRDWKNEGEKHKAQSAKVYGPYPHAGLVNESLKILRKIFPFKDKKSHDPRHEEFYKAIGQSPVSGIRKYHATIKNLELFLEGKKTTIVRRLERDMKAYAKKMQFEEAGQIKRTLYALKHINDMALIKNESTTNSVRDLRMEAYDIAHLSGTNTVGAMVVSVNSERQPKEYRTFKISHDTNNDIANLVELVSRRLNHPEWAFPDLIIVDGNENQKRAVEAVLSARRMNIPVVAVVKDDKHKARAILGLENGEAAALDRNRARDILALNAEAHRFTINYHRKRRSKGM